MSKNENNGFINEPTRKKITVIPGDGKIEISEVKDHLNVDTPSSTSPKDKHIVIPPDNSNKQ